MHVNLQQLQLWFNDIFMDIRICDVATYIHTGSAQTISCKNESFLGAVEVGSPFETLTEDQNSRAKPLIEGKFN